MREVLACLRAAKRKAALAVLLTFASAFMTLVWNALVRDLIDLTSVGARIGAGLLALGVIEILISALLGFSAEYASSDLFEDVGYRMRERYARALASAPLAKLETMSSARALSILQNELNAVCVFLRGNALPMADDTVRFALSFGWMLLLDWRLALLAHLPLIPIFFYIGWSSRAIQTATGSAQSEAKRLNAWAEALTAAFPVVRVFRAEEPFRLWHDEALARWREAATKAERRKAALMSLSGFLHMIPLLLLFLIGGAHVIRGEIGIGTLYVFINLSGNVSGVVKNLPGRMAAYRAFRANCDGLEKAFAGLEDEK